MGNSKARAIYEANLSDNFRRSQNDQGIKLLSIYSIITRFLIYEFEY